MQTVKRRKHTKGDRQAEDAIYIYIYIHVYICIYSIHKDVQYT